MADPENIARGHKANLANPHTSEESKERSRQVLEELEGGEPGMEEPGTFQKSSIGKDPANVARGLKAAVSNPHVSEEAKERDRQRLQELEED
ncbi:Conidiation protein 6-domain-containing protein [Pisolithus croceorrhizus]|nr:Conidiation protein 6-domain-containing protein [Pisolithus croceorrhizus]KAI6133196.1 Conidiation protein 6-domain-containing protein [Pisolithus croceorrhizus]KAI6136771.1 Conidiation protein 6-domain-containing protein [Pisolithus sp. B1]KAI6162323.1 Conidiation protein 6-domain-containing protein [Pisolithus thermaeus]